MLYEICVIFFVRFEWFMGQNGALIGFQWWNLCFLVLLSWASALSKDLANLRLAQEDSAQQIHDKRAMVSLSEDDSTELAIFESIFSAKFYFGKCLVLLGTD